MDNYDISRLLDIYQLKELIDNLLKDKTRDDKIHQINITREFLINLLRFIKITLSKYDNTINCRIQNKNKHFAYVQAASEYAYKNSVLTHKHGCVIVFDNNIVSYGCNKKNKSLKNYSIHAEEDAINNLNKIYKSRKIIKECILFVVRISNSNNDEDALKMSKPCLKCASKIRKTGIKTVYYSVDDNYVNDFLYGQIIKFNNHEL